MRYIWAIISLVLGTVLLFLGIGQRSIFSHLAEASFTTQNEANVSYVLIPGTVFTEEEGDPYITLDANQGFIALGKLNDMQAWLAPVNYRTLTRDKASKTVSFTDHTVQNSKWQDPIGSDLWIRSNDETSPGNNVNFASPVAKDQAILLATTHASQTLDATISVRWERRLYTPLAGPMILLGTLFSIAGVVLYILFVEQDRRVVSLQRRRTGKLWGIRDFFKKRTEVESIYPEALREKHRQIQQELAQGYSLRGAEWDEQKEQESSTKTETDPEQAEENANTTETETKPAKSLHEPFTTIEQKTDEIHKKVRERIHTIQVNRFEDDEPLKNWELWERSRESAGERGGRLGAANGRRTHESAEPRERRLVGNDKGTGSAEGAEAVRARHADATQPQEAEQ